MHVQNHAMARVTSRLPDDLAERAEYALRRAVPLSTRRAFLATELYFNEHGHTLRPRAAVERFGSPLQVITAWNPIAEHRPRQVNDAANRELRAVLAELTNVVIPVVGSSPSGDWLEPGYAVVGQSRRFLRNVARDFGQLAIFSVTRYEVEVLGCGYDAWSVRRPMDIAGWTPEPQSTSTLSEAMDQVLGRSTDGEHAEAHLRGWVVEPDVGIGCPRCERALVVFGCEPPWPPASDSIQRHTAVVCPSERQLIPLDELSVAHHAAIDARREFRMARLDAAPRSAPDVSYGVYCIELDIKDAQGRPVVYVGETRHTPQQRFAEHMAGGVRSSRVVAEHGRCLRPDLIEGIPRASTRAGSLALERWLHAVLTSRGWDARGGH